MARPESAPDKLLSRRILVNVRRDQTTSTPRVIWSHEFAILESIFDSGNVTEVAPETLDEGYSAKVSPTLLIYNKSQDHVPRPSESLGLGFVFVGDAESEYARLVSAYRNRILESGQMGEPWVEYIYGRWAKGDFKRMVGRPALDDLPVLQLRALVKDFGYTLPSAGFESDAAERAEAVRAKKAFEALDHGALVKLAQEVGVQLG